MSGAYVGGFPDGGFQRVRDNANAGSYPAELNQQKQLDAERQRQKQLEQDRRDRKQADAEAKQKASREADAAKAFREYHTNPESRRGVGSIHDYSKARFGWCYDVDLKQALTELRDPEMLRQYMPERFAQQEHAKADAATLDHVIHCEKCRLITNRGCLCGCFQVGKQYGTLRVTAVNGDSCTARCSCGREGQATRRELEDGTVVCMECEEKEKD